MEEDHSDRPLKYETTRPVSGKRTTSASGKLRKGLAFSATVQGNAPQPPGNTAAGGVGGGNHQPDENQHHNSPNHSLNNSMDASQHLQQQQSVPAFSEDFDDYGQDSAAAERPPISVRVQNAITRPEFIDRFAVDLQNMENLENEFRKNTLSLQKKLNLPENGMI